MNATGMKITDFCFNFDIITVNHCNTQNFMLEADIGELVSIAFHYRVLIQSNRGIDVGFDVPQGVSISYNIKKI